MSLHSIERKYESQKRIVKNQMDEIEHLKNQVLVLKIDGEEKDRIINSISALREDLLSTVEVLKKKREEYDKLICELQQMKAVMNRTVFNGKWRLIKLLLK